MKSALEAPGGVKSSGPWKRSSLLARLLTSRSSSPLLSERLHVFDLPPFLPLADSGVLAGCCICAAILAATFFCFFVRRGLHSHTYQQAF